MSLRTSSNLPGQALVISQKNVSMARPRFLIKGVVSEPHHVSFYLVCVLLLRPLPTEEAFGEVGVAVHLGGQPP